MPRACPVHAIVPCLTLLVLAASCSGKSSSANGECGGTTCDPGYVCLSDQCAKVCQGDGDCSSNQICADDVCVSGTRDNLPVIFSVDGTADPQLTINGQYLSGSAVTLSSASQIWTLPICNITDSQIVVELPSDLTPGVGTPINYTLQVVNQAGMCQATLPVLQGDRGDPGNQGPPGPQGDPGVPCAGCVDNATLADGAVTDIKVAASGITTRSKLPGPIAYEDEANTFGQTQTMSSDLRVGGDVAIGTTAAANAELDVRGEVLSEAILKVGNGAATTYTFSTRRYIVEAPPSVVGVVIPLDNNIVNQLCKDKDGCKLTVQMVNWSTSQPGHVASRTTRLFVSETSNWWRLADNDVEGLDINSSSNEWSPWDCYFTDAETSLGTSNERNDATFGFGLLNCRGCTYSDTTTTCRVVLED